jgi:hypothetical protein
MAIYVNLASADNLPIFASDQNVGLIILFRAIYSYSPPDNKKPDFAPRLEKT